MLGCLGARRDLLPRGPLRRRSGAATRSRTSGARSRTPPSRRSGSRCSTTRASRSPTWSALRIVQNIAIPERAARAASARLPAAIQVSSFGATECSSNLTLRRPGRPARRPHRDARHAPLPGMELKIVDPETGERASDRRRSASSACAGYARFEGYYKDPEQTALAIDADGWFHTGDLGSVDEDGRLRYAGRLKDMLKVGGENVSALEVEGYLAGHPAVNIVQVVGVPDARYDGGAGRVRRARGRARALTEDELDRLLRRPDRDVQGAALRPLRDRVADVRDEDPEVRPPRAARRRARRGGDHGGAAHRRAETIGRDGALRPG